ncbi:hypothetical protein PAPHI01_1667 [Pancytospora philotis]|nr:hypothetical protein PAPHI01_1667 [Pancytospora philotis]
MNVVGLQTSAAVLLQLCALVQTTKRDSSGVAVPSSNFAADNLKPDVSTDRIKDLLCIVDTLDAAGAHDALFNHCLAVSRRPRVASPARPTTNEAVRAFCASIVLDHSDPVRFLKALVPKLPYAALEALLSIFNAGPSLLTEKQAMRRSARQSKDTAARKMSFEKTWLEITKHLKCTVESVAHMPTAEYLKRHANRCGTVDMLFYTLRRHVIYGSNYYAELAEVFKTVLASRNVPDKIEGFIKPLLASVLALKNTHSSHIVRSKQSLLDSIAGVKDQAVIPLLSWRTFAQQPTPNIAHFIGFTPEIYICPQFAARVVSTLKPEDYADGTGAVARVHFYYYDNEETNDGKRMRIEETIADQELMNTLPATLLYGLIKSLYVDVSSSVYAEGYFRRLIRNACRAKFIEVLEIALSEKNYVLLEYISRYKGVPQDVEDYLFGRHKKREPEDIIGINRA